MKFRVGDKVSFINEKLSGIVTRVAGDKLYKVEIENGFEIDVHEKELLLVSRIETSEFPSAKEIIQPVEEKDIAKHSGIFSSLESDSIYFVSAPAGEMQVLTGAVKFILINKTDFRLLFSFSSKVHNKIIGLKSGTARPQSETDLISKPRPDMIDWQNLVIQIILFNEKEYRLFPPVNRELPLLLPDLKTEFSSVKGAMSYAKVLSLFNAGKEPEINFEELKKKYSAEDVKEEKPKSFKERRQPVYKSSDEQSGILRNETEVDLHIQCLVEDYSSLSNAEMLQIQLKQFRKEMDIALKKHYHRIIFIHGVGNGVLRNEILRELRSYEGISFRDASFEKYGYGATEVILN
ncbi:MAG: Smr/MutS family protein [Bacteroidia bacterium]